MPLEVAKPLSLIGYPGNKAKLMSHIFSSLALDSEGLVYTEPFFGGGNAYLNLPVEFASYDCSDALLYAIDFFSLDCSAEELQRFEQGVDKAFNLDTKEGYYRFRDYWNGTPNSMMKGLGFVLLAQHCVNHLVRFGPNGFNQAWGGVRGPVGPIKWEEYAARRKGMPGSDFAVRDFRDAPIGPGRLLYLDPPYSDASYPGAGVHGKHWTRDDDHDLIEMVREHDRKGGKFVLSSLLEVHGQPGYMPFQLSGFRQRALDKTHKARVGGRGEGAKDYVEGIITNIEETADA